jgi:hypothetical protein
MDELGAAGPEYAGVLAAVAAIFALGLDGRIGNVVETAVCRILGGDCQAARAQAPKRCLTGQTTTKANGNMFIALVQIDKDSILIREDYSDGTSRFTIVDDTEAAGELFAGAKAKAGRYGLGCSAEASLGAGLAGGACSRSATRRTPTRSRTRSRPPAASTASCATSPPTTTGSRGRLGRPARRRRRLGARPARRR